MRKKEAFWFYVLVSPWVFGFLAMTLGPMVYSFFLSLTNWDLFTAPKIIGLANYVKLFTKDTIFWKDDIPFSRRQTKNNPDAMKKLSSPPRESVRTSDAPMRPIRRNIKSFFSTLVVPTSNPNAIGRIRIKNPAKWL